MCPHGLPVGIISLSSGDEELGVPESAALKKAAGRDDEGLECRPFQTRPEAYSPSSRSPPRGRPGVQRL